jgi:hypothetical protein
LPKCIPAIALSSLQLLHVYVINAVFFNHASHFEFAVRQQEVRKLAHSTHHWILLSVSPANPIWIQSIVFAIVFGFLVEVLGLCDIQGDARKVPSTFC